MYIDAFYLRVEVQNPLSLNEHFIQTDKTTNNYDITLSINDIRNSNFFLLLSRLIDYFISINLVIINRNSFFFFFSRVRKGGTFTINRFAFRLIEMETM